MIVILCLYRDHETLSDEEVREMCEEEEEGMYVMFTSINQPLTKISVRIKYYLRTIF